MRILISNDDGIHAEGLECLIKIAEKLSDDVWVCAPEADQSGASHSLTITQPLRIRKTSNPRHFAVSGTPTDSVLLAMKTIFTDGKEPDLILSGVNRGANMAEDVTYSGTIAAAMEGAILGIRSIALSMECTDTHDVAWDVPIAYGADVIQRLLTIDWPKNRLMNVNFPNCTPSDVQGIKATHHGHREVGEKLIEKQDPKGRPYFWIGFDRDQEPTTEGCDVTWLNQKYISVTPLSLDLTDYKLLEELHQSLETPLKVSEDAAA